MNRRKLSGQTVTIVILSILLLCTVVFGGVYAYYSSASNRLTGKIIMANLKISMSGNSGDSSSSEILVTNGYVVPGQSLENTALTITNKSNTSIYIVVLYSVRAKDINDDTETEIKLDKPLIETGNSVAWYDYHFKYEAGDERNEFRCLVSSVAIPEIEENITVIAQNQLRLHASLGNEFQSKSISMKFQAYAIASNSFNDIITNNTTMEERAGIIVNAIYEAFDHDISI